MSAQLNALMMQVQPHFLFNTLIAITVLVRQTKSKDAEQMLGHLSDLLRRVLEERNTPRRFLYAVKWSICSFTWLLNKCDSQTGSESICRQIQRRKKPWCHSSSCSQSWKCKFAMALD